MSFRSSIFPEILPWTVNYIYFAGEQTHMLADYVRSGVLQGVGYSLINLA